MWVSFEHRVRLILFKTKNTQINRKSVISHLPQEMLQHKQVNGFQVLFSDGCATSWLIGTYEKFQYCPT